MKRRKAFAAAFIFALTLFITNPVLAAESQIQSLEALTQTLNALGGRGTMALQSATDLAVVAASRKQLLMALIEEHPGEVLRHAISPDVRANLPPEVQAYIEEAVEVEGELEVLIEDYPDRSRVLHFLVPSGSGGERVEKRLSLHFAAERPEDLYTGSRVRVKGIQINQALALESGYTSVEALVLALPNTFGAQKTVVLLVNFSNDRSQPTTVAEMKSQMALSDAFYYENSYEQTSLTADVFGWYTLPLTGGYLNPTCPIWDIKRYADQEASAAGIDLSQYTRRMYLFPLINSCGFTGASTVGGNPSSTWFNGRPVIGIINHEIGHALGLYHSNGLACHPHVISGSCSVREYGDPFDTMGIGQGHFNAFQKTRLGWLGYDASPPIRTVTTSGTYTLPLYERAGSEPLALRIPRGTTGQSFYVEFRRNVGQDLYLIHTGVFVHLASDSNPNSSWLLDMGPSTIAFSTDAFLDVGQTFTDPLTGITITTLSVSGTSAMIVVTMGSSCTRLNPSIILSPAQSQPVQAGTAVTYAVSVTNNDSGSCPASGFILQATVPGGWTSVLGSATLSLNAGASAATTLKAVSPTSTTAGTYALSVKVTNSQDPTYAASASAQYVIAPPKDTTPPTISLTSPKSGAIVLGTISLTASASDNVGVAKVEFYLDSAPTPFATDTSSPFSVTLDTTTLTNAAHTLKAKASDSAGNNRTASVSVTVDNKLPTVSLTAPANGATVSGTVALTATASDNVKVANVSFYLDGATLIVTDSSSPYKTSWNSKTTTDGAHTLTARALDTAGNSANSTVSVIVANGGPSPTLTLSGNPTTIVPGGSSTLTWSSTNATSCTASGAWSGSKPTSGTQSVSPAATATYSLSCTGAGTSVNKSVTITVSSTPGSSFSDDFNRADSTTLGNSWEPVSGTLSIVSNQVRNTAVSGKHLSVQPGVSGANQTASMSFSFNGLQGSKYGFVLRYQDPSNYYRLYRSSGGSSRLYISKVVNGIETVLASRSLGNPTKNALIPLTASVSGTTLTLTASGLTIAATDAAFSSGAVGFFVESTGSQKADDFTATAQ